MPPEAMASSEVTTASSRLDSCVRAYAWRSSSWLIVCGNLGARPKPPHSSSCWDRRARYAASSGLGPGNGVGLETPAAGDGLGQPLGLGGGVVAVLPPVLVDGPADVAEGRHAVAGLVREVGPAVERLALGGHEDGERPPTVAGHGLHGVHVDPVDIGPLLAVDLHVDEQPVHQVRGVVVLEGLVGHDVAPVAGRVPDGDQHRPVLVTGPGEGLVPPRVPVDRVVGVLAQVRAGLVSEAVGHAAHRTDGAGGRPAQSDAK